ncbi:cupin domain-containing protein [Fulvivirgaceae bacterium BMA10]|uniref:Cupin domain-containing protein n=1 Tax=Splendidivirga corallicola TaxID=3051826 RepID=A0ABT8KQZ7_9BACT|nr:cupin domain-containing protein [Fulvivirgaceae bacterium BMA10]
MKTNTSQKNYFGLTFISTSEETNGQYFLSETTIPAGDNGPPPHVHTREDEGFYIVSGELTFLVNDKEIHLKTGDYLNIEKGEKHTWRNDSMSDTKLLVTFAPAGIEGMFRELDEDMTNILEIGRKYGTEFLME